MTTTLKVHNLTGRSGRGVPNQFEVLTPEGRYFQSYRTIIAKIERGEVTLDADYWNYSKTTSRYLSIFLCQDLKEIKKRVKHGVYKLAKLNPEGHHA